VEEPTDAKKFFFVEQFQVDIGIATNLKAYQLPPAMIMIGTFVKEKPVLGPLKRCLPLQETFRPGAYQGFQEHACAR
jgi:hypothetical protein